MDIAEFIGARLDEDEARATALLEAARHAIEALKEPRLLGREIPGWHSWPDVEAMCLGMLRDIEAKRKILAEHALIGPNSKDGPICNACVNIGIDPANDAGFYVPYPCRTVRALGGTGDGHPDYRPEWKP